MRRLFALVFVPVVLSCGKKDATTEPPPDDVEVLATTSLQFQPITIDVAVGGRVTWKFQSVGHSVIFENVPGKPADIEVTVNSQEFRVFSTAGSFPYDCGVHPGMRGTINVK
jgi:plastocyanin